MSSLQTKDGEPLSLRIVLCFDCGKIINPAKPYLFSRPCIFGKRYRCEKCGKRHEFLPLEFAERWINPTIQIELSKIIKKVDDAFAKYQKNPNWHNAYYLDGVIEITERLAKNLEKIKKEK